MAIVIAVAMLKGTKMSDLDLSGPDFRFKRRKLKLTQAALGELLGCTRQHIQNCEDRITVPRAFALAIRQIEAMRQHEAA